MRRESLLRACIFAAAPLARRLVQALAIAMALLHVPNSARAITVQFTGVVTAVGSSIAGGPIRVGDPISGSFSYVGTAPDLAPADATLGIYEASGPFAFAFGSYTGSASTGFFDVYDDYRGSTGDALKARSDAVLGPLLGSGSARSFAIQIYDPTGLALSSDALPASTPDLDSYTLSNTATSFIVLNFATSGGMTFIIPYQVRGRILSLVFIPEPSTALLLALGIAGIGAWRRGHGHHGTERSPGSGSAAPVARSSIPMESPRRLVPGRISRV